MNKILLQCDNLCKRYQEGSVQTDVLHNVSFSVGEGEMMAIVGTSGSGKSTLLHLLAGWIRQPAATSFSAASR